MQIRQTILSLLGPTLLAILLFTSGCIAARSPLFDGAKMSFPLPQSSVLHGIQDDEIHASRVDLKGGFYAWENEGKIAQLRFVALNGAGIREGFFAAEVLDDGKPMYGLVERTKSGVFIYPFDAAPFASKLAISVTDENFSTNFATLSDLTQVFAYVAARIAQKPDGKFEIDGVSVASFELQVLDNAVPHQQAQGLQFLKLAQEQRAKEE